MKKSINTTSSFTFKGVNWVKIGRGALVASAGALLTYIATIIPTLDIPASYLPFITAILGVLVNVVRKWASSEQ